MTGGPDSVEDWMEDDARADALAALEEAEERRQELIMRWWEDDE